MNLTPREAFLLSVAFFNPAIMHAAVPLHPDDVTIGLRDYQWKVFNDVVAAMQQGYRRILVQAPTGSGKTMLAAAIHLAALAQGRRSQFVVHRKELIKQTSTSFTRYGLPHGFIASGWVNDYEAPMALAGIQTLVRRLDLLLPPDIAILDEAHISVSPSYDPLFDGYQGWIIGLTATPERLDGRGLGDRYDIMIRGPSEKWLIENRYLSPYVYYAPNTPDRAGLTTRAGDFAQEQAIELMNKPALVGSVVEHYLELARGQQGIVFNASRALARTQAEAFRSEGVRAAYIGGDLSDTERDRVDADFRAGEFDILTSVSIVEEGYDLPNVSFAALARITKSRRLHRQQAGRAIRYVEGKTATICDHAGNAIAGGLGLPDSPYPWTLEGRPTGRSTTPSDAIPVRQCKRCFRVWQAPYPRECSCGTEFPVQERAAVATVAGKLEKLTPEEKEALAVVRKAQIRAAKTPQDLMAIANERGYSAKWVALQLRMRAGVMPGRRR